MFKIKGNPDVEKMLNDNVEEIGEKVVMLWRDQVWQGSTVGLQYFCEVYDFDDFEFGYGPNKVKLEDYEYEYDWKLIFQAAYEWSTGDELPLEWIEPINK